MRIKLPTSVDDWLMLAAFVVWILFVVCIVGMEITR